MENEPFEDVFPVEIEDFPASYVSLLEGNILQRGWNSTTTLPRLDPL